MLSESLFGPQFDVDLEETELPAELEAAYDDAISVAVSRAVESAQKIADERSASLDLVERLAASDEAVGQVLKESGSAWSLCEALLERSFALREADPACMLRLAGTARQVADEADPEAYGAGLVNDLRARAWGGWANALRINDHLPQAEAAMDRAFELRLEGTGDTLLLARLASFRASLCNAKRDFGESNRCLDLALAIHRRYSEPHEIARILTLKGVTAGCSGDAASGIQHLAQSLALIDRKRDPFLVFQTLHNILHLRVELGEYEAADKQLRRMQPLYTHFAGSVLRLKATMLAGEIAAGLGDFAAAEQRLREARTGYENMELGYMEALTSLSLASVLLRKGEHFEVRELVMGSIASFQALHIERDALAAVQVLREAQERDQATVEVLRLAGRILRRLQREPATHGSAEML
jgi:tetratricopeptide (TPR) repeat protein